MKILIAPDKFKETFDAKKIASLISETLKSYGHDTIVQPMSDGGDGFLDAIENKLDVIRIDSETFDPLMRKITTYFLFDPQNKTAYIELAKTGSLSLLAEEERNPFYTTTYGLGVQIKQALELGSGKIYIGLGGSSTNDAGIGMAAALGWQFLDARGRKLEPIGLSLPLITKFDVPSNLPKAEIIACADVNNPLYGKRGAAQVYARQKGASRWQVDYLDNGLKHIALLIRETLKTEVANVPGSGAAGGTGAGIIAFLNGKIVSGARFVADLVEINKLIRQSDIVVTGEGKFDKQSLYGKVVGEIISRAANYGKPAVIVAGMCEHTQLQKQVKLICLFEEKQDIMTLKKLTPKVLRKKLANCNVFV